MVRGAVEGWLAGAVPPPHVTSEFGCTLTGPAGSVPVTVSSSEVHVMPTDDVSAADAAEVEVPGPRSRGSSDTVSPTVITLPSKAIRRVADEIDCVARREPLTATERAPYTVTGATSTTVSSLTPALDSVTSSSSAVPAGVPAGAVPTTADVVRAPVSDTASHSRMPSAANASGCRRTTPRRESVAEVLSRAVRGNRPSGGSPNVAVRWSVTAYPLGPGLRSPRRATDRRWGAARRAARRTARRCCGLASQASGRAATQRWLRMVNGMRTR